MKSLFRKSFLASLIILVFIIVASSPAFASQASSTNFKLIDSSFGNGQGMNSGSFNLTGTFSNSFSFGSFSSQLLPLTPGSITSCGKIYVSGTYNLVNNLTGISGTCFYIAANNVTINGNNHTITASTTNSSYAISATSIVSNGGSAYTGLSVSNLVMTGFAGGINANGNNGFVIGGNGGAVTISSSTLGSINANAGTPNGTGGSINFTGTNIDLIANPLSATGNSGSIIVNGSVLISGSEIWSGNDTSWGGSRTWHFTGTSNNAGTTTGTTTFETDTYSTGTVTGDAVFMGYTASSSTVDISGVSTFRGTGIVTGGVYDNSSNIITTWNLSNGSILIGKVSGDVIFSDTAYNTGTVLGGATFTATVFNSVSGIPNADPTGISNSHSISGAITFSSLSPVNFSLNNTSVWNANTSAWIFTTPGASWTFNGSRNTGNIAGIAVFNTVSQNSGTVTGSSTFNSGSYNSGTTADANFYSNSYNIGNVTIANFYDNSKNSNSPSAGNVSIQCNFYDSSLPGIGNCPIGGIAFHIPFYFKNIVSNNYDDLANWFFDATSTQPAVFLPINGDTIHIGSQLDSGPSTPVSLGKVLVASSTTGGGSFTVNLNNISGPVYLFDHAVNAGNIIGTLHVYGSRALSSANSGSLLGDVVLHDASWNDTDFAHNMTFADTSYNSSTGTVEGSAEFSGSNRNDGNLAGVSVVDLGASLSGTGTSTGNVTNSGIISAGVFNAILTNLASSTVNGSITNVNPVIFNSDSYITGSGQVSGDAVFNNSSNNRGVVSGLATFSDTAYNIGLVYNAKFIGENSENSHSSTNGIVSGTKQRIYNQNYPQTDILRNFIDSAWTVTADGTLVKLVYNSLIDIIGRNPNTTTTLNEKNGGIILRSLSTTTPISTCGVLDSASSTYTLSSNISGYNYQTCFIVRANNVTLDGAGHTVTAFSSSTSIHAIMATSSLIMDATSTAFTNLVIKNISFNNFAHGLYGRGTDVVNGIGGNGASTTLDHVVIPDIDVTGGDPIDQAGNGGNVYLETSSTTLIKADGGDSTACGIGGDGGNIFVTTDSYVGSYSNDGGRVLGCSQQDTGSQGHSGSTILSLTSASTRNAAAAANAPRADQSSKGGSFSPFGMSSKLLPVAFVGPLNLIKLPIFGDDLNNKNGTFSFATIINNFLFSELSNVFGKQYTPPLIHLFENFGLKTTQDLYKVTKNPLKANDRDSTPGYFSVYDSKKVKIQSYIAYDGNNSVTELIKVPQKAILDVYLVPTKTGSMKSSFNGSQIVFFNNHATIITPQAPGKYKLISSSTPLTLTVQVIEATTNTSPANTVQQSKMNPATAPSFISKIVNWFKKLW